MALHWRPVGPEPAQTYWLRRAVVAAAVLLVVVLLLQLLQLLSGGDDEDRLAQSGPTASASPGTTPGPVPTPGASASAGASATPDPSASATASATACTDEVLQVQAAADDESYAVGEQPRLELRITNSGATPCSRDVGQAAVELQVVSGDDRIWSSDDCAPGGEPELTVLQPGAVETSTVTWPGTRSLPGCQGDDEPADAGTYRVIGRVGELREQGESFVLQ
jgi:hypothetical protein